DLNFVSGKGTITPKTLTVSATAQNKVYDGNTTATVSGALSGVVGNDEVSVLIQNAAFASKDVANGKTVTYNLGGLSGTDAGNYVLGSSGSSATANITAKTLTVNSITADDKPYDGNNVARSEERR